MVQDQLIDYVSSQMKLGVSREAIKSALIGAGWAAGDIEDTLKKAENANRPAAGGAGTAGQAAKPSSFMGNGTPKSGTAVGGASVTPKIVEPQSIRVSDLISVSDTTSSVKNTSNKSEQAKPAGTAALQGPGFSEQKKRSISVMMIAGIVVILGLGGLVGFLYFQNSGLIAKVVALSGKSAEVASRVASLTSEVRAQNATTTALTARVMSLAEENAELKANLSFAGKLPAGSSAASSETVSISGALTTGRSSSYILTTPYGVLVSVANAKDARVDAALKPLVNSTSSVKLTGTHVPGSALITVIAVNGAALGKPAK